LAQANAIDPRTFEIAWHFRQLVKKFEFGCEMTDEEALSDFLFRQQKLSKTSPLPDELRCCMRSLLAKVLPEPPAEGDGHYLSEGRLGPGAVFEHASTYLAKLGVMAQFEQQMGIPYWCGRAPGLCTPSARLQAVPKDLCRKRTITVEPLARCWGQQAVRTTILRSIHSGPLRGSIMDQMLSDRNRAPGGVLDWWGRGLKRAEPRQKIRCRLGALTGKYSTIDLSNASDTMRYDDVIAVFPPWLTPLLDEVRSPTVEVHGTSYPLHCYAGMGNATTFVVETLFFWSMFTAAANLLHGRFNRALGRLDPDPRCGDVTVYGDDIVCRSAVVCNPWVVSLLAQTSIEINWAKSGVSLKPGFREACGEVSYHSVSLPSTLRLYGAPGSKEGAARYCDFASRCLAHPNPAIQLLGFCLCTWQGAPKAPLCRLEEPDGTVLCYREPEIQNLWSMLLRLCVDDKAKQPRTRWNPNLQRFEVQLRCVAAYERTGHLPVVSAQHDEGWYDYQLSLLASRTQCDLPDQPESGRSVRYPVPHRTTVRRRWVPGVCDPGFNGIN
jgi:hypothetical protein